MANKELKKRVTVKELKDYFSFKQLCGDENSLKRWIIAPDINRPGLELAGKKIPTDLKRVVLIGNKEIKYIKTITYSLQIDRFNYITDKYTPCIIITGNLKAPKSLLEIANKKNFPVFISRQKTYVLTTELVGFLSDKLAPSISVHGTMLNIYGKGVLITGKSGIGKSELALDLINRGHMLIADDLVDIYHVNNYIRCEAPNNLKRMLEVRGLGIIDISKTVGGHSFLNDCKLDFIIHLISSDEYDKHNNDRLNPTNMKEKFFDIMLDKLEIPMTIGKSMSIIIETAVTNYILKQNGYDSNEIFKENIRKQIKSKRSEL